jgi:hypothetical protein
MKKIIDSDGSQLYEPFHNFQHGFQHLPALAMYPGLKTGLIDQAGQW